MCCFTKAGSELLSWFLAGKSGEKEARFWRAVIINGKEGRAMGNKIGIIKRMVDNLDVETVVNSSFYSPQRCRKFLVLSGKGL